MSPTSIIVLIDNFYPIDRTPRFKKQKLTCDGEDKDTKIAHADMNGIPPMMHLVSWCSTVVRSITSFARKSNEFREIKRKELGGTSDGGATH